MSTTHEPSAPSSHQDPNWTTMFTVLAGEEEHAFTLHQKKFCDASEFFRAALSGAWKESKEAKVTLKEISSLSMKMYVSFVYGHQFDHKLFDSDTDAHLQHIDRTLFESDDAELLQHKPAILKVLKGPGRADLMLLARCYCQTSRLCNFWCDGDFLGDHEYQNAVMNALFDETAENPGVFATYAEVVNDIWENTLEGSMLRKWAVEAFLASSHADEWLEAMRDQLFDEITEIFDETIINQASIDKKSLKKCDFHIHVEGEKRCAEMEEMEDEDEIL